ncbi:MAG: hypothetical protein JNJ50_25195 [Acidobacteria bacterium]|nr:hypothetical protein [Acidobacteriota bacterium]
MKVTPAFSFLALFLLAVMLGISAQAQVSGSGTTNKIPKWTGTTTLGDSSITEDASGNMAVGATPNVNYKLLMQATLNGSGTVFRAHNIGNGRGIEGSSNNGIGVNAFSTGGNALTANSTNGFGIFASSQNNIGISASSASNDGVRGVTTSTAPSSAGVKGLGANGAFAGIFSGNVSVSGTLSKGGGSFKIDHPLDPENKYLYHSFVESPEMMNIYNGNVTTDLEGVAEVTLPDWFETLNRDFRYQLTVMGKFAQAIVAQKIHDNRFVIRTNAPFVEVSWQVTGVRQDAWANQNRIPVEEEKAEFEKGHYLHPAVFGKAADKSIEWAHEIEAKRRLRKAKEELTPERP